MARHDDLKVFNELLCSLEKTIAERGMTKREKKAAREFLSCVRTAKTNSPECLRQSRWVFFWLGQAIRCTDDVGVGELYRRTTRLVFSVAARANSPKKLP